MSSGKRKSDGGAAFPGFGKIFTTDAAGRTGPQDMWGMEGSPGMTLRDYFAAKAMTAILLSDYATASGNGAKLAVWSYDLADMMLAERSKP